MVVQQWPIERLKPYEKNARKIPQKAIDKVAASLQEFGWQQPIVVDHDGVIVVGHARRLAALKLGYPMVPVVCAELSAAQCRAYRLMDNRSHDEATWDIDILGLELDEIKGLNIDLSLTGFDVSEVDKYLRGIGTPGLTGDDDVPDVEPVVVTQPGDLWLMGEHRLLCGDSTKAEDVARVMAGEKADMVFTDPPYGVDYDGGTKVREKLSGDGNTALYGPCCGMAAKHSTDNAGLYLWHAGVKGIAAAAAAAAAGWQIRCELVWNKNQAQFGALSAQYKQKHEPAYYCHKKGKAPSWYGPTNEVTVWDCDRASVNEFHPTQKPVELGIRAISNSSKADGLVLDLFLGSGSTLVACEKTGRRCFGLEITPTYCDVIVRRWQAFTGRSATLEGDGRTFDEIATGQQVTA